jgi:hypothetical protein
MHSIDFTRLSAAVATDAAARRAAAENGTLDAAAAALLGSVRALSAVALVDPDAQASPSRDAGGEPAPTVMAHMDALRAYSTAAVLLRNCCEDAAACDVVLRRGVLFSTLAFLEWERRGEEGGEHWNA